MPRITERISSKALTLHDAMTHYECTICGKSLEWTLSSNKHFNQPTYSSQHCNLEYEIIIDTVKIRILSLLERTRESELRTLSKEGIIEANKKLQKQQEGKDSEIRKQILKECEPRAITMAKGLKEKRKREEQSQGDKEEAVIEELESQGDLKKDVPVGGEEFESEEPRQGSRNEY
jgi:hypothetical protein